MNTSNDRAVTDRAVTDHIADGYGHEWARPYSLLPVHASTGQDVQVHALVQGTGFDTRVAAALLPESASLYACAHDGVASVAELSAYCGVPLGVARVLLAELADAGHVRVWTSAAAPAHGMPAASADRSLLEEVLKGLKEHVF
jgi:hypothetical protein